MTANDKNKKKKRHKAAAKRISRSSLNSQLVAASSQSRNALYQQLFGPQKEVLTDTTNENEELKIIAYQPDPIRPYWTYITAGLSTPWMQEVPQEVSGFGLELMIKSPIKSDWPAQILKTMAYYIFNHMGTLSPSKRLALNSPIVAGSDSALRNILIWYADEAAEAWYQLPSGGFGIFAAIGVTDDEMRLAESIHPEYGTWCMLEILRRLGINQVTDPTRLSIFKTENIDSLIQSVKEYAEQFHEAFPFANQIREESVENN